MSTVDFQCLFPTDAKQAKQSMAMRDLAAIGCSMHSQGQVSAGKKMFVTALEGGGMSRSQAVQLADQMDGNEAEYFEMLRPHAELNFMQKQIEQIQSSG